MPELAFSEDARADLAKIEARIEELSGSSETADNFIEQILRKCTRLAKFNTRTGRPRPELLPGLRSYPYRNYIIFFRYVGDIFYVVSVLHGSRDIDAYFAGENEDQRR